MRCRLAASSTQLWALGATHLSVPLRRVQGAAVGRPVVVTLFCQAFSRNLNTYLTL